MKRYTEEVLLLYDSDEAGTKAALRAIPILREAGVNSRVVNLTALQRTRMSLSKTEGAEAFEERLRQAWTALCSCEYCGTGFSDG